MKYAKPIMAASCAMLLLANDGSCSGGTEADKAQRQQTATITAEANRQVGIPAITNFAERKLLRDVYERRDRANLATFVYTQGLDGKLVCLGHGIGYGVPYGAQMTNPMRPMGLSSDGSGEVSTANTIPQPEPNGLFMPDNAAATWIQLVDPQGHVQVVYAEPNLVVSPFAITGPAVTVPCP